MTRSKASDPVRKAPALLFEAQNVILRAIRDDAPEDLVKAARAWLDDFGRWQQDGPLVARPGDGDTPRERDQKSYGRLAAELATPAAAVPERVNGKCAWCRDSMPVPSRGQGGGRTKRFCSPACKQAHHRWSKDPERYPDARAWTVERRGLYATRDR
jgi:hypothetical protein